MKKKFLDVQLFYLLKLYSYNNYFKHFIINYMYFFKYFYLLNTYNYYQFI